MNKIELINKYELIILTSYRIRELYKENIYNIVSNSNFEIMEIALREILNKMIDINKIKIALSNISI